METMISQWFINPYVVCEAQHDFRRSVPSCGDIFCHEALISSSLGGSAAWSIASSETEIAYF